MRDTLKVRNAAGSLIAALALFAILPVTSAALGPGQVKRWKDLEQDESILSLAPGEPGKVYAVSKDRLFVFSSVTHKVLDRYSLLGANMQDCKVIKDIAHCGEFLYAACEGVVRCLKTNTATVASFTHVYKSPETVECHNDLVYFVYSDGRITTYDKGIEGAVLHSRLITGITGLKFGTTHAYATSSSGLTEMSLDLKGNTVTYMMTSGTPDGLAIDNSRKMLGTVGSTAEFFKTTGVLSGASLHSKEVIPAGKDGAFDEVCGALYYSYAGRVGVWNPNPGLHPTLGMQITTCNNCEGRETHFAPDTGELWVVDGKAGISIIGSICGDTPAPPTDAPPTDAPPTDIPPTNAPPTDAPATDAPPTDTPPTDAPATDAPPTSLPDTLVPSTGAPPTDAPTDAPTAVPATAIPKTGVPPTNVPPTGVPSTPEPTPTKAPTQSPEVVAVEPTAAPTALSPVGKDLTDAAGATTDAAAGLAGLGALAGASGPGAAGQALMAGGLECRAGEVQLPPILHPLRFEVSGSKLVGAVLGNVVFIIGLTAALALAMRVGVRLVYNRRRDKAYAGMDRARAMEKAEGVLRYPSGVIQPCVFFLPVLLNHSFSLLVHGHTVQPGDSSSYTLRVAVAVVGVTACAAILFLLSRHLRMVPAYARVVQPKEQVGKARSGLYQYVFGASVWCTLDHCHVERMGVQFQRYRELTFLKGRYYLVETVHVLLIALVCAFQSNDWNMCTLKTGLMMLIFLLQMLWTWKYDVFLPPFLGHLMRLMYLVNCVGLLLFCAAYSMKNAAHWTATAGATCMNVAAALALIRALYDMLYTLVTSTLSYRRRIAERWVDERSGEVSLYKTLMLSPDALLYARSLGTTMLPGGEQRGWGDAATSLDPVNTGTFAELMGSSLNMLAPQPPPPLNLLAPPPRKQEKCYVLL